MRKTAVAAVAGLLLVAGQAAASNTATVRIGDRVGADADAASDFAGPPLPVLPIGAAVVAATIVVATDDDSESD